jgi:beta-galactosidase
VVGEPHLSVNALHHTTNDLDCDSYLTPFYPYLLPDRPNVTLNLDFHQRGLGGIDSWGALPRDAFRLQKAPFSYRFRMRLVSGSDDLAELSKQNLWS